MRAITHIANSRSAISREGALRCTAKSRPRLGNARARTAARRPSRRFSTATARVLVKHGFDGLTTNAVADAAGVSIGSLYQYFPNKEALVAALIEQPRSTRRTRADHVRAHARRAAADGEAVRAMIELTIENHAVAARAPSRADSSRCRASAAWRGSRELARSGTHTHGRGAARPRAATSSRSRRSGHRRVHARRRDRGDRASRRRCSQPARLRDPALIDEAVCDGDALPRRGGQLT